MYAVGVDVSNGWSTVAVLWSKTDIVIRPFNVTHNSQGFANLLEKLGALDGEVRVVMEHTFYDIAFHPAAISAFLGSYRATLYAVTAAQVHGGDRRPCGTYRRGEGAGKQLVHRPVGCGRGENRRGSSRQNGEQGF